MKEIIFLGLILTLPAWFIIIRNFLWDLSFWQKKNYSVEKFTQNILWDIDKDSVSHFLILVKFLCLALLTIGFQYFVGGVIGIATLLIIWSFEAFWRLEFVFITKEPKLDILKPRNLISLLTFITILFYSFLWISLPFSYLVDTGNNVNYAMQLVYGIPSAYIYLLIITAIFCLFDLGTSLITALIQIFINKLVYIRRLVKLFLFQNKVAKLRDGNRIILNIGDTHYEIAKLLKIGLENIKQIDVTDPRQVLEFILDNKIKNQTLFVSCNSDIKNIISTLQPEIVFLNSTEIILSSILKYVPARTKVIANKDIFATDQITKLHKGEYSFFSSKNSKAISNQNIITPRFIEIETTGIRATYLINSKEESVHLKTFNKEYVSYVAAALCICQELERDSTSLLRNIESGFSKLSKELFIEGDNDTKIYNFENHELNYLQFVKNINSACRQKGTNNLIVLSDGLGIKNIPEGFFECVKECVDCFITNDQKLNKELDKRGIKNFSANNLKSMTFLARRHSNKGDIFLIEGTFKDSIIQALKKN